MAGGSYKNEAQARMRQKESQPKRGHVGFDRLKSELAKRKGVKNPGALAAAIGRKKYGAARMQAAARAKKPLG